MAEMFMGVDCSTESGLAKALKNRQRYQAQENLSEADATSVQDEYVDTCDSDDVEQEPSSVNTAIVTMGASSLPAVTSLTDEQLVEQQKVVENWFTMAKQTLKHNSFPGEPEKEEAVTKAAICMNGWLLNAEVERVNRIKRDVESGKYESLKDSYSARGWKRKKWDLRKDLTFDVINQMTQDALDRLALRKFDLDDMPTLYKANQLIHKAIDEETDEGCIVLEAGETPQLPMPEDTRFNVVYGDLAYKFNVEEVRPYIHEDAVGFFWVDDLNIQASITILQKLNFKIQEFAYWDIDKKLPGTFTTRQCRSMVVATKGNAPKPADFKLDSIVHEHEIEKSAQKPQYYAERIQ
ncbi:MAG: hypothetical protein IKZ49_00900, partial [Alphaproteobacteria bacterium]|nr:hypothetical protein [Alphaproteobacteria bacterium]